METLICPMKSAAPIPKANLLSVCLLMLMTLFSCERLAQGAVINQQPQSTNVLAGSNVTFTVAAGGQTPLGFRWQLNATNLTNGGRRSGVTTSNLIITAVAAGDAGGYRVVVSNSISVVTSSVATLTVLFRPAITQQPPSQVGTVGGAATFAAGVSGTAPLGYRWFFNGTLLIGGGRVSGATNTTLVLTNLQTRDAGNYTLIATNAYGAVTSAVAVLTMQLNPTGSVRYVNLNNPNPAWPYSDWNTAAANIQDAVDAADPGDKILVTNGVYQAGNRTVAGAPNCVAVALPVSVMSVNGPAWTSIDGGAVNRCVYLTNGASLTGITLTNGTAANGGGAYCESAAAFLVNCVLSGNSGANSGGGAYQGSLTNCALTGNSGLTGGAAGSSLLDNCLLTGNSGVYGGAAIYCTLNGCTLSNSASTDIGGGAYSCTLNNCTLIGNSASENGGGAAYCMMTNCVLVANSANGLEGGGVDGSTLESCTLSNNSAGQWGGNAYGSTLNNCLVTGGATFRGGGANNCTLNNCIISNNLAYYSEGGGAESCTLSNCVVIANSAGDTGGGANGSTLINCSIINNGAPYGGGVNGCVLTNCTLTGNVMNDPYVGAGGAANGSFLFNCLLTGNASVLGGGGASQSTLVNCTVVGNSALTSGGGVDSSSLTNCIVYYNTAPAGANYSGSNNFNYCCTTPLPSSGVGNFITPPLFANQAGGNFRLYPGSPCINTGNNAAVSGVADLDGNVRIVNGVVDIGAYEFQNFPFIEVPPQSQTVAYTEPLVSFGVVAVGPGTLTYQWRFNGTNIVGATNATLTLTNIQFSQAGNYSVTVINSFGSVVSSNAVLTVNPATPPVMVSSPADALIAAGSNVTFTALAGGAPAPVYQWYFNGVKLANDVRHSGVTTTMLQISNAQTSDTGPYQVVATNIAGSVTSFVANLSVLLTPSISLQPASQTLMQGSSVTLNAVATGGAPLSYQWYFNGNPLTDGGQITGSATTNLTISSLQFTNSGNYVLIVNNPVGSATSTAAVLAVLAPPIIFPQPAGQNVVLGSNAVFSAVVAGTQPIGYQWFFNQIPLSDDSRISGSTTSSLTIGNTVTNDSGGYQLVASNAVGTSTSLVASLTVWLPVTITQSPSNQTVAVGAMPTLTAAASGSGILGYQWLFNNSPLTDNGRIFGSATASLSVSNAQTSDTGNYSVVVTNLLTSATSAVATVTAVVPPAIVTQPKGRSVPVSLPTTFNATASGGAPLSYQWQLNGTNLSGATSNNYTNPAVTTNDVGAYQLVVTNSVGVVTSSVAMLTIGPVAAWGNNSLGQALPPPGLTNVIAISGGSTFSLALKGDGTVVAWGAGPGTNVPAGLNNIVAISAGSTFGLAVRSDGIVQAWGSGTGTNVPLTLSNAVLVAGASSHGMALRAEGMVVDWGTDRKVSPPIGLSKVVSIADGIGFSVVARADGTVVSWGAPGVQTAAFPLNVPPGLSNVVSVAAGSAYALALKSDGRIVPWGASTSTNIPANATNIVAIASASGADQGAGFNLGLRSNGLVVAWGLNSSGQTNVPPALSNVVAIAAGTSHGLALVSDGSPLILRPPVGGTAFSGSRFALNSVVSGQTPLALAWTLGAIGNGATNTSYIISNAQPADTGSYQIIASNALGVATSVPAPVTVVDSAPFVLTQITNLNAFLYSRISVEPLIAGSGPLQFQWRMNGTNVAGATNNELAFARAHLTNAGPYTLVVSNSFGVITSAVVNVKVSGPVVVWGDNVAGLTNVPASLTNVIAIDANPNSQSSLALRADGTVAGWGYNGFGVTNVPASLSNVVEIAGSFAYGLALKSDGTVRTWGATIGLAFSNAVMGLSNIVALEADSTGATFLRTNGSLTRLSTSGTVVPIFPPLTNVVALSSFDDGVAALRADGMVFTTGSGLPPTVTSNVLAMGFSRYHGLYLKRDSTLFGWGTPALATNNPSSISNMIDVAANINAKFAVRSDGTVASWSTGFSNSTNVPAGLANVGVLQAGSSAAVALLFDRDFPPVFLPDALDTTALVVSSKGSPQWFGQTSITHDGVDAAQSASIGNNTASSMRLWLSGPFTVSFWWKVSSETNHDFLSLSINGVLQTNISGETGWQQCTVDVLAGPQMLVWTYAKDGSGSAGLDAGWVDQIAISPARLAILTQPTDKTVQGGSNVTFTVLATGIPPLLYVWQKYDLTQQNASTVFASGNPSYTLSNVTRANSGTYHVMVLNQGGSVTSSNVVLTVHVPQLLGTPVLQPDGSLLLTSGDADGGTLHAGDVANLQALVSTNLVDWIPLPGALTLVNGQLQLQDPAAIGSAARFYRIVENW